MDDGYCCLAALMNSGLFATIFDKSPYGTDRQTGERAGHVMRLTMTSA